jgi:hypothetical protein
MSDMMGQPPLGAPMPGDPMQQPVADFQTAQFLQPPQPPQTDKRMSREKPEIDDKRKALVASFCDMVKQAKGHWDKVFRQMEKDQKFAAGKQWPEETKVAAFNDGKDDLYVANIVLRHIQGRVAAVYAKNPKAVARKRQRILSTAWDGTLEQLQGAQQTLAQAQAAQDAQQKAAMGVTLGLMAAKMGVDPSAIAGLGQPTAAGSIFPGASPFPLSAGPQQGLPPLQGSPPAAPLPGGGGGLGGMMGLPQAPPDSDVIEAEAIVADAKNVQQQTKTLNRIARTLELLYQYEIDEQQQGFKTMMKLVVRRAATAGVGWVRLGFQRVMGRSPDLDGRIADVQQQLELVQRISAGIADDDIPPDSAEVEQLRLTLSSLTNQQDIVLREGLQFGYPKSTAIIPDPRCVQLRGFLGCDWVAEEFCLSPNEVMETYGVDVRSCYTGYDRTDTGTDYERARAIWQGRSSGANDAAVSPGDKGHCLVWELYNRRDGLRYVMCDGWPDFLEEPKEPDYTERFWPWYVVAFNETVGEVYPPSDVKLIRPMQLELNRMRQGLREHRFANRPKTAYAEGTLSQDDLDAFQTHPVNALISVSALQPGQNINDVLMAVKGVPVDPNLYEVNPVFQDLLRVIGDQQADLGGMSSGTATEANYAATVKAGQSGSAIDDIDDTLTEMAHAGGQILLLNVSEETVKNIVGPGAVWPTLTKAEVARDVYLSIEAGSSGRPNQALELQNFERLAPILMQIPGIKPQFLAQQAITRLDDRVNLEEAVADGMPSITAQNGMKPGASMGPPGAGIPQAQGPQGASNAPAPPPPQSSAPSPVTATPMPAGMRPN